MFSCLFIIGDVLPFARTTKKKDKEELFNTFIMLRKSAKICRSCLRNCTEHIQVALPKCVPYNEHDPHIFVYNISEYICKQTE